MRSDILLQDERKSTKSGSTSWKNVPEYFKATVYKIEIAKGDIGLKTGIFCPYSAKYFDIVIGAEFQTQESQLFEFIKSFYTDDTSEFLFQKIDLESSSSSYINDYTTCQRAARVFLPLM